MEHTLKTAAKETESMLLLQYPDFIKPDSKLSKQRQDLLRTITIGVGTTAMGFCSGGKRLDQLWIQCGQVGIYSQGAG